VPVTKGIKNIKHSKIILLEVLEGESQVLQYLACHVYELYPILTLFLLILGYIAGGTQG
jgi:hypothetical protein